MAATLPKSTTPVPAKNSATVVVSTAMLVGPSQNPQVAALVPVKAPIAASRVELARDRTNCASAPVDTGAASATTSEPGVPVAVEAAPAPGACGVRVKLLGLLPLACCTCERLGAAPCTHCRLLGVTGIGEVPPIAPTV